MTSAVSRFDAVCDKEFIIKLDLFLYLLGGFLSFISFGHIVDVVGRKKSLVAVLCFIVLTQLVIAVTPFYNLFAISRCIEGYLTSAICNACLTATFEFIPTKWRDLTGVITYMFFGFSLAFSAMNSWFSGKWTTYVIVSAGMYCIPLFYIAFFAEESPRWLYVNKPLTFSRLIDNDFKANQLGLPNDIDMNLRKLCEEKNIKNKYQADSVMSVLRNKKTKSNMLFLINFSISSYLINFGLMFGSSVFRLNAHYYYVLQGGAELVGAFLLFIMSNNFSRRKIHIISFSMSGLFCVISGLISKSSPYISIVYISVVIGRLFAAVTNSNTYVWASEISPTSHRALLTGLIFGIGRLVIILIPYINMLTEYIWPPLTPLLIGGNTIISSLLCIFIDETKRREVIDTIN